MSSENLQISFSDLCSAGWRRTLMRGFLQLQLRNHFSLASNLLFPSIGTKLWTNNIATSTLFIDSSFKWDPRTADQRPAVLIKAGKIDFEKIAIGNLNTTDQNGNALYTKMGHGSFEIRCLSSEESEAETLAAESALFLQHFSRQFEINFNLMKFEINGIGAPTVKPDEYHEMIVVPVQVEYGFDISWYVTQYAPALKPVTLSSLVSIY